MDEQQQRIKIAEAYGYYNINAKCWRAWFNEEVNGKLSVVEKTVPDYLNDLNAMHDAIESLSYQDQVDWVYTLGEVLGFRNRNDWNEITMLQATAEQRAEAFLRTLGLWEGDK